MSDFSSQGVGAAACANADVASPVSATAIKKVLVEDLVIVILPAAKLASAPSVLNKSRTPLFRQWHLRRIMHSLRLCDFPHPTSRLCSRFRLQTLYCQKCHRMIRMNLVMKIGFGVA